MGRSLSTEPSIQPSLGEGFHGTSFPVVRSLVKSDAAENTNGTEHDAHLLVSVLFIDVDKA